MRETLGGMSEKAWQMDRPGESNSCLSFEWEVYLVRYAMALCGVFQGLTLLARMGGDELGVN